MNAIVFKKYNFNMDEDVDSVIAANKVCQMKFLEHKSKLDNLKGTEQKLMVMHYFKILDELSDQACDCLKSNRLSVVEVLTRVIMEQVANQSYIAADEGKNAQSLLIACKKMLIKNGENWLSHLNANKKKNPAAQERIRMGKFLTEHYTNRWPGVAPYPGVRRLFESLDWENQYHAFYVPLCDSVHTFADDMANIVDLSLASELCDEITEDGKNFIKQEHRRLAIYNFSLATGLRCVSLMNVLKAAGYEEILIELQPELERIEQILTRNDEYDHSRI